MYVDASAFVAILLEEPERDIMASRIGDAKNPVISNVSAAEAAISVGRHLKDYLLGAQLVEEALKRLRITVITGPVDIYQDVTRVYAKYGRGTGHAAKLNFGDCFSYAYAKREGIPLLYKGNDFVQTDIESATGSIRLS